LKDQIDAAARRVLESGRFILGPEVRAFEEEFAAWLGVEHTVGVASGTDAIHLALRACGIGPGDEVITVAHTAVATVVAVEMAGARPVLVDVDPETYTMDPAACRAAISPRTKAILPVHLYGHPADMTALGEIARRHGLLLVEDCAQAHGARIEGTLVGTFGEVACFSFYPTKNLGAFGDGGAVVTRDAALAERVRRLRNYGQTSRYRHESRGFNSRLDELQAAILRVRLVYLDEFNAARRQVAAAYAKHLRGVSPPVERPGAYHVYHLYVVRHQRRDALREHLRARGVGTLIHYPTPAHLQPAYADLGYRPGSLPLTEQVACEIVSLPLYVGMGEEEVRAVCAAIAEFEA
jgi:dTDP-3-amino-3,4,6-trideoxy-alpha-D-glucose transaminase